jgi:predicted enzyme related to lactoylglutathione lyase
MVRNLLYHQGTIFITKLTTMFSFEKTFSSFSVDDLAKAKDFYRKTLGIDVKETPEGLALNLSGGNAVFIYPKPNHAPATFTVLNFQVKDIEATVDELSGAGVKFEHYDGELQTDKKGIMHGNGQGPGAIAWFKDPAGNFISVIEDHGKANL